VRLAPIAVAPVLPSDAALASFGLAIDRVRIIVVRPAAPPDTLADTTVALPPDSATLELDLRVPLIAAAETLEVSIIAMSGTIALFQGTAPVEVTSGGAPATPTEIPVLTYVGPGAGVDSLAVSPALPFIYFNDSLRFQVEAFQAGVPVSQFYVSWSTSDTNVARVNGAGLLRAPATRTSVRVIARTPGGAASDSTTATFLPFPTQLAVIAGGGQAGPVGQPLATQLEVEVRALDNLPVPGVDVRFRSLSGGTPADTIVTSDAQGRARVTGVLGGTPGPQTFQASLPAFPGITAASFNATATGIVISPAMSIVTVASGSVISGNTVTLRLQGKDGAGNDVTTGGANVVFTRTGGTSTGAISATADSGNGIYTAVFTGTLAGTATTIGATINGSPVTTALPTIAVSPGAISATGSYVSVSSGTVASGSAVTLRLQGQDAAGNIVTTGGATVVFSASGGTSTGNIGATADSGTGVYTATFTGVLAGTGTSIGATVGGNPVTTGQPSLVVIPGTPAQLAFIASPSVAQNGVVISPAVQVVARDLAGNTTPAYAGDVTIAIGTNPVSGSLTGTLLRTASGGVATFGDLSINGPGSGYTLSASSAPLASATSAPFDVVPPSTSVNSWIAAADGLWSTATNWSKGTVPAATDTAAITLAGTYTVTLDVNTTVGGVRLGGSSGTQTLSATGRTLDVTGATTISASGVLRLEASQVTGGGTLTNAGTLRAEGVSSVAATITTLGTSVIRVHGNPSTFAQLTVPAGFTNFGQIQLTDSLIGSGSIFVVTSGTLTNALGATIATLAGAGGQRQINAQVDNQGTFSVAGGPTQLVQVNKTTAAHANSGAINVTGGTLRVLGASVANGGDVVLAGGNFETTLSGAFDHTGDITIAVGDTLRVAGGTFNYSPGATLAGLGVVSVGSGTFTTLNLGQNFVNDTLTLELATASVNGPGTLTNRPGRTLAIRGSLINAAFANEGILVVGGTNNLSGLTTVVGSMVLLQADAASGQATLNLSGGFTNNGAIVLTSVGSAFNATLRVTGAAFVNASGASISADAGAGGNRTLDVLGTVFVNHGFLAAGSPVAAGRLTILGGVTAGATSVLDVDIGGLSGGTEFDSITVSGNVAFDGILNLERLSAFTPVLDDSFVVMTYAGRTGTFTAVFGNDFGSGIVLDTVFESTRLVLVAKTAPVATHLAVLQQPPAEWFFNDTIIPQIVVAVLDDSEQIVTGFSGNAFLVEQQGVNATSKLVGTLMQPFFNGIAVFNDLFVDGTDTLAIDVLADAVTPTVTNTFQVVSQIVIPGSQGIGRGAYFATIDTVTDRVYTSNTQGDGASIVDARSHRPILPVPLALGQNPGWEGVDPTRQHVFISDSVEGVVYVIDEVGVKIETTIDLGPGATQPVVDAEINRLYVPTRLLDDLLLVVPVDLNTGAVDTAGAVPIGARTDHAAGAAWDPERRLVWVAVPSLSRVMAIEPVARIVAFDIPVGELPYGVAIDTLKDVLYVTLAGQHVVQPIDLNTGSLLQSFPSGGQVPQGLSVDLSTGLLFVANKGTGAGNLAVLDSQTREVLKTIPLGKGPGDAEFHPRNRLVYVPDGTDNTLSIVKP